MPRLSAIPSRWRPASLLILVLAACHDAPRDNPFDPELTPAVELEVALDDTAGTVTLTWTPYEGEQAFAEYRVLRNIAKSTEVDTLVEIAEAVRTSFVDSLLAPNTAYVYRVSVVNASGFEMFSPEHSVSGHEIRPVELLEVEMDLQEGQATLRWTRFTGARFEAYQIERRSTDEADFAPIARQEALGDTAFTDPDLVPDITYFYRIVVEAAGQPWPSNPSGRLSFSVSPVVLLDAQIDAAQGTTTLTWTRFAGARFQGYRVERRSIEEENFEVVAQIESVDDTLFTDTYLQPDLVYSRLIPPRSAWGTL